MSRAGRRRWFQFSVGELLLLTAVLGIAWWQCSQWPVTEVVGNSPVSIGQWMSGVVDGGTMTITRPPNAVEITARGLASSLAIAVVWSAARVLLRPFHRSEAKRRKAGASPRA